MSSKEQTFSNLKWLHKIESIHFSKCNKCFNFITCYLTIWWNYLFQSINVFWSHKILVDLPKMYYTPIPQVEFLETSCKFRQCWIIKNWINSNGISFCQTLAQLMTNHSSRMFWISYVVINAKFDTTTWK